jgi:hypothetical protein
MVRRGKGESALGGRLACPTSGWARNSWLWLRSGKGGGEGGVNKKAASEEESGSGWENDQSLYNA